MKTPANESETDTFLVRDGGFSLLELLVCLVLLLVFVGAGLNMGQRLLSHFGLLATSVRLVEDMRWCQSEAESSAVASRTQFSNYTPEYWIYDGTQLIEYAGFMTGTGYQSGYLQLQTNRVIYDAEGNAQVSGVIRLVSGPDNVTITLYMNSGLQALSGLP